MDKGPPHIVAPYGDIGDFVDRGKALKAVLKIKLQKLIAQCGRTKGKL